MRLNIPLRLLCLVFLCIASFVHIGCSDTSTPDSTTRVDPAGIDPQLFPELARDRATQLIGMMRADQNDAPTVAALAMLAHAHSLDMLAVDLYTHAATIAPDAFELPYLRGLVLMGRGMNDAALDSLQRARDINDAYPPLILRLAELHLAENRVRDARPLLADLVEKHPAFAQARLSYGRLLASQGDPSAAVEQLRKAVDVVPHYGAAHYSLAETYRALGNEALADTHLDLFERHRRAGPASLDAVLQRVDDMRGSAQQAIVRAGRLSAAGKLREAIDVFENLLITDPDNVVAHTNLIGLYGSLGEIELATSHYRRGVVVAPDEFNLHNNYGVLLLKLNRYDEAADAFRAAVAIEPRFATAHRYLGLCLQRLGNPDGARASFRAAIDNDPLDHQSKYLLASALLDAGDGAGAVEVLSQALEPASEKTPSYLHKLAQAHFLAGNAQGGFDALARARALASQYGQAKLVANIDDDFLRLKEAATQTP